MLRGVNTPCWSCFIAVEAFSLQELWKFASLSKNVVNFYSEVSMCLSNCVLICLLIHAYCDVIKPQPFHRFVKYWIFLIVVSYYQLQSIVIRCVYSILFVCMRLINHFRWLGKMYWSLFPHS